MKSLSRLMAVMRKEVRQMRRDRLTFAMIFGIPIMQLLLFGYAINTDVRNLVTAIADEANTHLSREFVARLNATQVTDIRYRVGSADELEAMLEAGEISLYRVTSTAGLSTATAPPYTCSSTAAIRRSRALPTSFASCPWVSTPVRRSNVAT